jgi:hemerythrin
MAWLDWSNACNVSVEEIHEEHKEMFDAIRELESAVGRSAAPKETGALLRKLLIATSDHFTHEEAMMREAMYPGLALHIANHHRLIEKLKAFMARHGRQGQQLDQHALAFLRDWLIHHIQSDDQRVGDWMTERKKG